MLGTKDSNGSCETESKTSDRIQEIIVELSEMTPKYLFAEPIRGLRLAATAHQAWEKMSPEEAMKPFSCVFCGDFDTLIYSELRLHKETCNSRTFLKREARKYEEPF
jgi:hypothetical protein